MVMSHINTTYIAASRIRGFSFIFGLLLLLFASPGQAEDYYQVNEDVFSIEVPKNFKRLIGKELEQYIKTYISESKNVQRQYSATSTVVDQSLLYIDVYYSPQWDAMFSVARLKIPLQPVNYIDLLYDESNGKIEWGKAQGRLVTVYKNELEPYKNLKVLHTDFLMQGNNRLIGITYFNPKQPYQIIQLSVLVKADRYNHYEHAIATFLNHFDINVARNIDLGGHRLYLSEETQRYLIFAGESYYPANKKVLPGAALLL
jgi:hypothetical protein